MKSLQLDRWVALKLREIEFEEKVEIGNIIIPDGAPTPYVAILAESQEVEYLSDAAQSELKLAIYAFDRSMERVMNIAERIVEKMQDSTDNFEGVHISECRIMSIHKEYSEGIFGSLLTFRISTIEDL